MEYDEDELERDLAKLLGHQQSDTGQFANCYAISFGQRYTFYT